MAEKKKLEVVSLAAKSAYSPLPPCKVIEVVRSEDFMAALLKQAEKDAWDFAWRYKEFKDLSAMATELAECVKRKKKEIVKKAAKTDITPS